MTSTIKLSILALLTVVSLSACKGGLKDLSNQELAAKADECVQGNPTSPGRVTACENIKSECARRREQGNFAC